jgi:hypothetical protein
VVEEADGESPVVTSEPLVEVASGVEHATTMNPTIPHTAITPTGRPHMPLPRSIHRATVEKYDGCTRYRWCAHVGRTCRGLNFRGKYRQPTGASNLRSSSLRRPRIDPLDPFRRQSDPGDRVGPRSPESELFGGSSVYGGPDVRGHS